MLLYLKNIKSVIYLISFLAATLVAQDLEDLSFGDDNSLDIATWNIEWFPKNNQIRNQVTTSRETKRILDHD